MITELWFMIQQFKAYWDHRVHIVPLMYVVYLMLSVFKWCWIAMIICFHHYKSYSLYISVSCFQSC